MERRRRRASPPTINTSDTTGCSAVFPREGRADEPVEYEVIRHHEGRLFATQSIVAAQSRGPIGTASVSLHVTEDGPELQTVEPVGEVPGPDHQVALGLIPWEARSADDLDATTTGPPEFELWMRTTTADPELAPALAAYATDLTLIGTALRPLDGLSQRGNAPSSPRPSPPTPSGSTALSPPTTGCCCASTARCWRTAAVSAGATSSPTTACWWRRTPRKPCCAYRTDGRRVLSGKYKRPGWTGPLTQWDRR